MDSDKGFEKLSDSNYETWAAQMQSQLHIKRLSKYVDQKLEAAEHTEGNLDALAYMRLAVRPNQLRYLKGVTVAYDGWKNLQKAHQKTGPAYELMLFRKLQQKCVDFKEVHSHIEQFYATVDELQTAGSEISDNVLVYLFLSGLPKSFVNFEVAVTAREVLPDLAELKTKVEDEYARQAAAA